MAGHSKWANIQHRKSKVDAKRGKIFTRINRELSVAAREGGSDPDANPRLRLAVQKAQAANMPKDTIERTIKKAAGELEGVTYEEVRYEGYAPGGVAVIVECLTDNRNRTVAEVRHAFSKHGGNLGNALRDMRVRKDRQPLIEHAARRLKFPHIERAMLQAARLDKTIKGLRQGDVWDELLQLGLRFAK
mgnify:CR=1 FL=1